MKVTFITNACAVYEQNGYRLLADPWLVPGAFGTWTHDPPLKTKPTEVADVDALYISHIHPDHLCEKTLAVFRRDIPIVTLRERLSLAEKRLCALGFTEVRAIEDRASTVLGPFTLTVFGPFTKHPFHADACELGNVVDSALLVEHGGHRVLNCNDNTPSVEAAHWLRADYGPFDLAQLNYNNAGPYPACFDNLTDGEKRLEADRCVHRNLMHMADVARTLRAWVVQPFAGQYKLGFGLEHLNPVLGTCSPDYARKFLNESGVPAIVLAEGDSIDISQ